MYIRQLVQKGQSKYRAVQGIVGHFPIERYTGHLHASGSHGVWIKADIKGVYRLHLPAHVVYEHLPFCPPALGVYV